MRGGGDKRGGSRVRGGDDKRGGNRVSGGVIRGAEGERGG